MTRSTELESESMSTIHYKTQNVEKESLLSQNWTASEEEDMNALSNIEEENMNALLFKSWNDQDQHQHWIECLNKHLWSRWSCCVYQVHMSTAWHWNQDSQWHDSNVE